LAAALTAGLLAAPAQSTNTLDIYVVDPEGGKAALLVTPAGQAVLIDTGSPGDRDVDRIMEAITAAGVKKIDYLVSTHYHVDHIGGMQELVTRIPVETFVDHGPTVEGPVVEGLREQVAGFQAAYAELYGKAKHIVVKPGDTLPIDGLDWRIVTSAGQVLQNALPGAGQPNAACADFTPKDITDDPENGQSVGSLVTFGQFRLIDLGDLLWNVEGALMCPNNRVGTVDLYMVSHHGLDSSGSKALVHGIQPRVAVMQNGTRKGGTVQTFDTLQSSPGFEDLWQAHWSYNGLIERNPAGVFIANVDDAETIAGILTAPPRGGGAGRGGRGGQAGPTGRAGRAGQPGQPAQAGPAGAGRQAGPPAGRGGVGGGRGRGGQPPHTPAYWIKISAESNGTFTVTNSRNGFSQTYTK
jgi:beta-lactamase superfamily II metal-dependent hydrolase